MKFTITLSLLVAAVAAQSDSPSSPTPSAGSGSGSSSNSCDALPIVETCLKSETAKHDACKNDEYDCLCAAAEAIATCFNNCPEDERAAIHKSQVAIDCGNASIHGTAAASKTPAASGSATASESGSSPTGTADDEDEEQDEDEASSTDSADEATESDDSSGVAQLALNTGSVLLAVAGVVAAVL